MLPLVIWSEATNLGSKTKISQSQPLVWFEHGSFEMTWASSVIVVTALFMGARTLDDAKLIPAETSRINTWTLVHK